MHRYFPNEKTPRRFPNNKDTIARIEKKVLAVVGFSRFRGNIANKMMALLQKNASMYPRQRQLCKAFLNLLIKENVAIPAITTVQDMVSRLWNSELNRITTSYYRYTSTQQRKQVLSLLTKTDDKHRIISIKKDMKQFRTTDINKELEKHNQLKPIFEIAKTVIPKLQLPNATVHYYAELINYYNGARLKQINSDAAQLYLLCYSFSRFQKVNDNLLEAFKKRTLTYASDAKIKAEQEASKYIDEIKKVRQKVYDLLMAIKNDENKNSIPKAKLFKCIPESELGPTAEIILSDKLDKELLYWKQIEKNIGSIALNLRPLFLNLDITIVKNELLKNVVSYMK